MEERYFGKNSTEDTEFANIFLSKSGEIRSKFELPPDGTSGIVYEGYEREKQSKLNHLVLAYN